MEEYTNIKKKIQSMSKEGFVKKLFGYVYQPSGSRMRFHETCLSQSDFQKVQNYMAQGDLSKLDEIKKTELSSNRMQCYIGQQKDIALVQLGPFVPHKFVDITDVITVKGKDAELLMDFFRK